MTQAQFAEIVGISQQAVSELVQREILRRGDTGAVWLKSYCANLREQAAGRASDGDLDLVQERARLAKEQADRVAMENMQTRREMAPVIMIESALANVAAQVCGILEAIPVMLRRQHGLSIEAVNDVTESIAKARNAMASVKLEWVEGEEDEQSESGD